MKNQKMVLLKRDEKERFLKIMKMERRNNSEEKNNKANMFGLLGRNELSTTSGFGGELFELDDMCGFEEEEEKL